MRRTALLCALFLLFAFHVSITSPTHALEIRQPTGIDPGKLPEIMVADRSAQGLGLQFSLPVLSVEELQLGTRAFRSVAIPGGSLSGRPGEPALPTFTRLLAIPDRAAVTITVESAEDRILDGFPIVPMQPDEGTEFAYNEGAFAGSRFGDHALVEVGEPALFRDLRVVPLTFRPVQYDGATQSIRVAHEIRVSVSFAGENLTNAVVRHRASVPPSFDQMYGEAVVNYEAPPEGVAVTPGTWLLICPNDGGVITRLQPLLDWRKRQGYNAVLATTAETGSSRTQIKDYIQNAYNTWDNPLEYVVLAGDATTPYKVETWFENQSGYNGEGDHPYTQLEGNDVLADIHIGRLSYSSYTELEVIVNKILGYETNPPLTDAGWFRRACLVGDPYDSGYSTVQLQQWIKWRLRQIGYAEIDTIFNGDFVTQIRNAMNRGDTIMSYRGIQGMSGWTNSNTYALTNGWEMPFCVVITCDTGSFYDDNQCRAEGFLRANGGVNSPRGGIAAIGTATTGTHTRYNNCMMYGIYYGLLYENQTRLGPSLTRGKMEMFLNYQGVDPNHVIIWSHWNNLMGDPAVDCWTGYPDPMTVDVPSSIPVGANAVVITVHENGGAPCEGAQVCLHKEGETHVVGYTKADGTCELPITPATAGTMLVTVTKHNRFPQILSVPVGSQQRYCSVLASALDDDASGESAGNGDGVINPGESIELRVQLKNYGTQSAPSVQATVACDDPYVQITDGVESFGTIAANGTAWCADDFGLTIDRACPHGHEIVVSLWATSGGDQWHSLIVLETVAGDLVTDGTYTLSGVGGNGRLDPGEAGQISIRLVNTGGASAVQPLVTLLSMSEFIDVPDGSGTYATIPAGGNAENTGDPFTIHVAAGCYEGYQATLELLAEFSGGMRDTTTIIVPIGQRSTDDPCGPDRYGYYAFDNTDTAYPEAPVYSWIDLDPNWGGDGTEIVLGDTGDYQDKSVTVTIPFPFQYYGKVYTRATVCSNGWLAMGSQPNTEYRNWTIPGAGGPQAMIAPFWDDLFQMSGAKVLQKYDAANHRWIVHWSRMRNDIGNQVENFEAILYDPAFHPTETGDGEIVFQYETVANIDGTDGYATVGIESEDQSDGVLVTFFNQYAPGAANLTSGRAIRFVPKREVLLGTVYGTVRNATTGTGLPGATVAVVETGKQFTSGSDGAYTGQESPGTFHLLATKPGFAPDTSSAVVLQAGGSVRVDFDLRDVLAPFVTATEVPSTPDTIGTYTVSVTIQDASPLSSAKLYYRTNGGAFSAVDLVSQGGDRYRGDIPAQRWRTKVEYYVGATDAAGNVGVAPPEAPETLYVFYVAPLEYVLFDQFETESGWLPRGEADTATSGAWIRVDPNGTYHFGEPVQPEDDHTAQGTACYVTGDAPPGSAESAADVDGGVTTLTSPILNLAVEGEVVLSYYRWYTNDTGTGPGEDYWVVQVTDDNGASWVDLENTNVSERQWKRMEFDLSRYIDLTNLVRIRFRASDEISPSIVEAAVDDIQISFLGLRLTGVSGEDAFGQDGFGMLQPNPFRSALTIPFQVEKPGHVSLEIFDVQGRVVRKLVDGVATGGAHRAVWDGRDPAGRRVSAGMYIVRLTTATGGETRKAVLLR